MIKLGKLPSQPQKGLQSKSQTAKKMVTALNAYARTNKITQLKVGLYEAKADGENVVRLNNHNGTSLDYFVYDAPSEKFPNKNIEQFFTKSIYIENQYLIN